MTLFLFHNVDLLSEYKHLFFATLIFSIFLLAGIILLLHSRRWHRLAEKRIRALLQAVEATTHSILITNQEGIIQYCNIAFCSLTGYTRDELYGNTPAILCSGQMPKSHFERLWKTILAGKSWNEEIINKRKDGSLYIAEQSISPLKKPDGQIEGFVAMQIDASEKKEAEEKLIQAKMAAEEADRAKGSFLANMSHEIRTPLNGILGSARLIHESSKEESTQQWIQLIEQNGNHLAELVNDILELSQMEAGQLHLQPVFMNPVEALQELLEKYEYPAQQAGNSIKLTQRPEYIPPLLLDPLRFRQVMSHLISNAVKFTQNGHITICISWQAADSSTAFSHLKINVEDTGIGIEPSKQDLIFQSFYQADAADSRQYPGTGLGLSIAKRLVQEMNGSLALRSSPGKGSTFTVLIDTTSQRTNTETESNQTASGELTANTPATGEAAQKVCCSGETIVKRFPNKMAAFSWAEYYLSFSKHLRARAVPAEIGRWALEQCASLELSPNGSPETQLRLLAHAADEWNIREMNTQWDELDTCASRIMEVKNDAKK